MYLCSFLHKKKYYPYFYMGSGSKSLACTHWGRIQRQNNRLHAQTTSANSTLLEQQHKNTALLPPIQNQRCFFFKLLFPWQQFGYQKQDKWRWPVSLLHKKLWKKQRPSPHRENKNIIFIAFTEKRINLWTKEVSVGQIGFIGDSVHPVECRWPSINRAFIPYSCWNLDVWRDLSCNSNGV